MLQRSYPSIDDSAIKNLAFPCYPHHQSLAGPPDWWVETLAGFVDDGFDTLVFWPVDPSPDQVELFAGDVAPHLRRSG